MSKRRPTRVLTAFFAVLALVAGFPPAAFAGDGGDGEQKVIRIQVRDCEGEDCPGDIKVHKMVFVGEDGEVEELTGHGLHWVGEGGHHGLVHLGEAHGGKAGFLGVMLTPMTPELRAHQGVPESAGVLVSKVLDDSPAARAGVRVGDVISAVDGEAVTSPRELAAAIRGRKDGDLVTLELWRDGVVQKLTTAVEEVEGLGPVGERRIEIRCEGGDCEGIEGEFEPYDCATPQCEVQVRCTGDGCECTVNGESVDCATIPGPHNRR